ncbi:MAG: TolC family protein [Zetaproteobacteria bacterium]|nr:TolC family protein [Zetaproteobacteria bacterium]
MYTRSFMMGIILCVQPLYVHAESLQESMHMAAKQHPMLQMAEQNITAAKGNLMEQGAYAYNPELLIEPQRRRLNGGGATNDYYLTFSQGIEMGGKQALRERSAKAMLHVAQQHKKVTRQQLSIQAAKAYVTRYFANRLLKMRQQQRDMLMVVKLAVVQKMAVGQSNQLAVNLAQSALASALNATTLAKQNLMRSQKAYALALGQKNIVTDLSRLQLPELYIDWKTPEHAYQIALASRPDLLALQAQGKVSDAQVALADAARISDLTLSAKVAREAGDQLLSVAITVPFALWNNHTGAYRASLANQERMDTRVIWAKQQLRYDVENAIENHRNAMQSLSDIRIYQMQQSANDTIRLAQQAYDAGELDLEEWVVHIRQALDAQITTLDIIKQAWFSRILLAQVLGHPEYILQGIQS